MCIAIVSPKGKKPSEAIINSAYSTNSDGAGIAWRKEGKIHWKKGLDLAGIKEEIAKVSGPFIAHFRITSVGPKCPELTHPFPITSTCPLELEGSTDAVLFQNGTYSSWEDKLLAAVIAKGADLPPPPWSDTRAISILVHHYGENILHLLNGSSRFAVFDSRVAKGKAIRLFGEWHEHEEMFFSNKGNAAFYPTRTVEDNLPFTGRGYVGQHTPAAQTPSTPYRSTTPAGTSGTTTNRGKPAADFDLWQPFDKTGLEIAPHAAST